MMCKPDDLNERIAKAKGWEKIGGLMSLPGQWNYYSEWLNPDGIVTVLPDYIGTLGGIAELLWELGKRCHCVEFEPYYVGYGGWRCSGTRPDVDEVFEYESDRTRPGDCIAMAWLGIFEGE